MPELAGLNVLDEQGRLMDAESPVTMHELLNHTARFSYGFVSLTYVVNAQHVQADLWAAKDLDELAKCVAKLPLKFQPSTKYHYSITVDLTGLFVQCISGQPFGEYLEEHIFTPLNMTDTFFEVPRSKRDCFLPNYFFDPESVTPVDIRLVLPFGSRKNVAMRDYGRVSLYSGSGRLVSTAMDYARFAEALRNGGSLNGTRILGPKTVAYIATDQLSAGSGLAESREQPGFAAVDTVVGFGLGFSVVTSAVKNAVVGSVGEYNWGSAAGTVFWIDPVEELVAVSMIQLMNSPWPLSADLKVAVYQAMDDIYQ